MFGNKMKPESKVALLEQDYYLKKINELWNKG
jgi:hypothetical protein